MLLDSLADQQPLLILLLQVFNSQAKKLGIDKVYGMVHGIEGFLEDQICDLDDCLAAPAGVEMLKRTPSAFLGSCQF